MFLAHTLFGPPGTGKTTSLSKDIARSVERWGRDRVVVASLTKTAAAEIKGRGIDVETDHVGTLHAVCKRAFFRDRKVLDGTSNGGLLAEFNREYARTVSLTATDEDDPYGEEMAAIATESDKLKEHMQLLRMRMVDRALWPPSVAMFAAEWEAWKSHTGTIDYTDMIERAYQIGGACPFDPAAIYYDEAQDGSKLELAVIKQWTAHAERAIVAGDDDQCLYSWRGASVNDFLSLSDQHTVLSQSYRLPRTVHAVAERWVHRIANRQPKDYRPRDAEGWVVHRAHSLAYPEGWMAEVDEHLAAGRSVMLLAACRYMLVGLLAYLKKRGTLFHNPYRPRAHWNPVTRTARRLLAYLSPPWTWGTLHSWVEHVGAEALPRGAKARIANNAKDDALVPYAETAELIPPMLLAGDLDALEAALLPRHRQSYVYPLCVVRRHGAVALHHHLAEVQDRPGRGLMVGTIHSVKGGEADVVYLWPELSPSGYKQYTEADRDSVLRVMYVGMTRAREGLVLCAPQSAMCVAW